MRRLRMFPSVALLAGIGLAVALLFACQDTPRMTEVDGAASLVTKTLTIHRQRHRRRHRQVIPHRHQLHGDERGRRRPPGARRSSTRVSTVTLTGDAEVGPLLQGLVSAAAPGPAPARVTMSVNRNVEARFLEGPFRIRIAGGVGTGSGRVTSQPGLSPGHQLRHHQRHAGRDRLLRPLPGLHPTGAHRHAGAGQRFTWGPPCSGTGDLPATPSSRHRTIEAVLSPERVELRPPPRGQWGPTFQTPGVGIHAQPADDRQGAVLGRARRSSPVGPRQSRARASHSAEQDVPGLLQRAHLPSRRPPAGRRGQDLRRERRPETR